MITDVIVQGIESDRGRWLVEILENSTVKTRLGEMVKTIPGFGVAPLGSSNNHFESGIPIQAGATLQARVWNTSPGKMVEVTISGYVW